MTRATVDIQALPRSADRSMVSALILLPFAIWYYAFLLTAAGTVTLATPLDYGLTFNSMLLHLSYGRFDVDPAVIGHEGYLRDGAVYAYFGIFPALLRAPFLILRDFATTDFTRLSCLFAVSLMASFKVLTALLLSQNAAPGRGPVLSALLVAAILISGPQIEFLSPSIFVESVLWSGAFAAIFVYLLLRGWVGDRGFTPQLLTALALVAGLCLLTRVSTALGLYIALGLLLLWRSCAAARQAGPVSLPRALLPLAVPALVLLAFAGATGFVNYQRWGNPLVFVDMSRAIMLVEFPERAARLQQYGEFNPIRLGFGLIYYLMPIWVLRDSSGQLLWGDFVQRTLDAAELPPSSFLLSDPLLVGLAVYGAVGLIRGRGVPNRVPLALAAAGFLIPIFLMLIAISMAFRYRMEFYPLLELCAFVGFRGLLTSSSRNAIPLVAFGTLAGIGAAQAVWLLNAMSPSGPASLFLGNGSIIDFYGSLAR